MLPAFLEMTRTLAEQEQAKDDEEMTEQLLAALNAAVQDWQFIRTEQQMTKRCGQSL